MRLLTTWSRPLGDPFGGTDIGNRDTPQDVSSRSRPAGLPDLIQPRHEAQCNIRMRRFASMPSGHLALVVSVNGDDFTPYNEAFLIKKPGEGKQLCLASGRRDPLGQALIGRRHSRHQI